MQFTGNNMDGKYFIFRLSKCQNSTENDFGCQNSDEINAVSDRLSLQTYQAQNYLDFSDYENPIKTNLLNVNGFTALQSDKNLFFDVEMSLATAHLTDTIYRLFDVEPWWDDDGNAEFTVGLVHS